MDKLVKWFQENYPELINKMQQCSHHYSQRKLNPYHLEDTVFAHTMMVCQKAQNAHKCVQIAALLHDIGKCFTRAENHEKQRVSFYSHEPMSAFLALDILLEMDLTEEEIIHIFQMISLHTEPFKLEPEKLGERLIDNLALASDLNLLRECDEEGRFHQDTSEYKKPFTEHVMLSLGENKYDNEVVCLIGLPCSGKSTVRAQYPDHGVLSWDDTMMEMTEGETYGDKFKVADDKAVRKAIEEKRKCLISEGKDVIIDMTNLSRKARRKRLSPFPKSYRRKAIVCLTGMETIMERNEQRKEIGKFIEPEVFERMIKSFYCPLFDEFDSIEWRLT